jgi:flagellar motor protein MotB
MRSIERKPKHEHVDSEGSWAISYGDMITLLLSFFVLYFTVDHTAVKANQMQDALMVRLKEAGMKAEEEGLKRQLNMGETPGESVDPTITERLGADIYEINKQVVVDFQDVSFFSLGNIEVSSEGKKALEKFAKLYLPFAGRYQINIQAYTDTRKVRSENLRYRDNIELSALRSIASMRILQKAGLPLDRMKIAGYGELMETQERLMKLKHEKDPLMYTRKIVLTIEPARERN